jgi:hypothetical protein
MGKLKAPSESRVLPNPSSTLETQIYLTLRFYS